MVCCKTARLGLVWLIESRVDGRAVPGKSGAQHALLATSKGQKLRGLVQPIRGGAPCVQGSQMNGRSRGWPRGSVHAPICSSEACTGTMACRTRMLGPNPMQMTPKLERCRDLAKATAATS